MLNPTPTQVTTLSSQRCAILVEDASYDLGDCTPPLIITPYQTFSQPLPEWSRVISHAADSIASAIQTATAPTRDAATAPPRVLDNFIPALPCTSGEDSAQLVRFLSCLQLLSDMSLTSDRNLIIGTCKLHCAPYGSRP